MLTTEFLGYTLKNPMMLTEGPLSGKKELIEEAAGSGPGLIFTKGIRPEPVSSPVPYMKVYQGSLMNADWSCIGIDAWEKVLHELDIPVPLITSIAKNYVDADTAIIMAKRLVKAGSKIISFVDYNPAELVQTVKLARPVIKVPIMVKLPPFLPGLEEILKQLVNAGIDAVAAMDSIGPGLVIDSETGEASLGSGDGSGYLSGKAILPFTLKYIYEISRFVDVPVVGVGGVTDTEGAVKMMMAGATGVGMATAPMLKGFGVYNDITEGLEKYILSHNLKSISEIRGKTRMILQEKEVSEKFRAEIDEALCINCGLCLKVCYSNAINCKENTYIVERASCVGCGLCAGVCSKDAIHFN